MSSKIRVHFDYEHKVTDGMTICGVKITAKVDTVGSLRTWDELPETYRCKTCQRAMVSYGVLPKPEPR